jgi:hypothetical protein
MRIPFLTWSSSSARTIAICLVAMAVCFLTSSFSYGQSPIKSVDSRDIETLEGRLERFFTTLTSDAPTAGPEQAFTALLTGGPLLTNSNEQKIKETIEGAKQLPKQYGEFNGFEKVKQVSVGKDVCVMTYLYKGKSYPVSWHFTFYRPESSFSWVCIGVRFHSTVEDLAK